MKNKTFMAFSKYVTLSILGMLGLSFYILADTFFVSKGLGSNGLAALNLAISIYSFIHGIGLMLGIGGGTKYGILKAQKEGRRADEYFTHTIIMGLTISFVLVLVGVFFSSDLSRLLGANEDTFSLTNIYLKVILIFAPFFILNNILLSFVRNDGEPRLSMMAMLIGSFSNIILDYIFIFPMNMGMFGAVLATGFAPIISIGVLSIHFIKKHNNFSIRLCKLKIIDFIDICMLGLSSLITEVSSGIVLILFNLIILGLSGNMGIAAYGIIANLALIATAVFIGIAQGIQPMVSEYFALHKKEKLKKVLQYTITFSLVIAIGIYLFTYLFTDQLIAVFNKENNTILADFARQGLRIYFIGFIFAGFNIVISAFLSAIQIPEKAFLVSITRGFLAIIPFAFIFSSFFGMTGVWISFISTEFVATIIALFLCYKHVVKQGRI